MKIYRLETSNEFYTIAANTTIEALQVFSEITEIGLDEFEKEDDIEEIPEEDWDNLEIQYPDDEDRTKNYRQAIEGVTKACIIGSSVY